MFETIGVTRYLPEPGCPIQTIRVADGLPVAPIEPVVVDGASNWPLFAEKARELIQKDKVAAVFGCLAAGLSPPPDAVSPFTPGCVSVTVSSIDGGRSIPIGEPS